MNYHTMNLFEILFIAGFVLVAVLNVYSWIYNAFSHTNKKSCKNLRWERCAGQCALVPLNPPFSRAWDAPADYFLS